MIQSEKELMKIKEAFERVKSDILHLYEKTKRLEQENNRLKKEIVKNQVQHSSQKKSEEQFYIGHNKTKKLHRSQCPYANTMNGENKVLFTTIEEALKSKYSLCTCLERNNME